MCYGRRIGIPLCRRPVWIRSAAMASRSESVPFHRCRDRCTPSAPRKPTPRLLRRLQNCSRAGWRDKRNRNQNGSLPRTNPDRPLAAIGKVWVQVGSRWPFCSPTVLQHLLLTIWNYCDGRVAEWFKAPVLKFVHSHLYWFVLIPPCLISFAKFNSSFHPLPSIPSPLPIVGDHFGDHFAQGSSTDVASKPLLCGQRG